MTKQFTQPSFRTGNSHSAIVSPSGRYIAQIGARISIWDISRREKLSDYKLIKNEHYVAFSPDEAAMVVKNANGELVFFKTQSGEVISSTGRFRLYMEGSSPSFSPCGNFLYDPSWGHGLRVWDVGSAECVATYGPEGETLSSLVRLPGSNRYVYSSSSKHPRVGYSKLFEFHGNGAELQIQEIRSPAGRLKNGEEWQDIDTFALAASGNSMFLVVRPGFGGEEYQGEVLVKLDIESGDTTETPLGQDSERRQSCMHLSAAGPVVVTVMHSGPISRMSFHEWQAWKDANETEHLVVYDSETLQEISRIHWPELAKTCFHPDGGGIVLASRSKSGYVNDFRSFFEIST